MIDALRKGWCPGALRPMEAKDGLLVRLRVTGGILPAATAHALAELATRHGNGLFDLSARGNLQMRGVREDTLADLQDGLQALGLLDTTASGESVRNVVASPLAGLHDGIDIRPLAKALEARLAADATLHALPGKFGFLINDGSQPTLASVDMDVRFDWDGAGFAIGLAGHRETAARVGVCRPTDLVAEAARIAKLFLATAAFRPDARRMRDVVTDMTRRLCVTGDVPPSSDAGAPIVKEIVGSLTIGRHGLSVCLGLAAPFGRLDAAMLHRAAVVAERTATAELRLTPFRVILVPGAAGAPEISGFITDPDDPRLAVAACTGSAGCARGTTDTHADATSLAETLVPGEGITLHVSGCEKGCAKPSATPLTLVARDGRYDVVRNGRPGDPPGQRNLDLAACREFVRRSA